MPKVQWEQQNDEVDENGFFLEGEAAFEADRKLFAEWGAPDTEALRFVLWEATDRDAATIVAEATDAFLDWVAEDEFPAWRRVD